MEENIKIAVKEVKRAANVKSLGDLIEDRLSFKNHVSVLQKHESMATGMLKRVPKLVPAELSSYRPVTPYFTQI